MGFYDKLSELCRSNGTTPAAVAREIGLSNSAATYWKRGSVPKYETLKRIADYFDTSIEELLGIEENRQEEIHNMTNKIASITKMDKEEVRSFLIEDEIRGERIHKIDTSIEKSNSHTLKCFHELSEEQLKEDLLENFLSMNLLGKIESVKRIRELFEIPYYKD